MDFFFDQNFNLRAPLCPYCWRLAELGYRQTLQDAASLNYIHEKCFKKIDTVQIKQIRKINQFVLG